MGKFLAGILIERKEENSLDYAQESYTKLFRSKKYAKYQADTDIELIASGNDDIIVLLV